MFFVPGIVLGVVTATTTTAGTGLGIAAAGTLGTAAILGKTVKGISTGSKALTTAKTFGSATKTYGALKATSTFTSATKVPTTVATTGQMAEKMFSAAARGTSAMVRQIPFAGETTAELTNAAGSVAGDIATKYGASETTASIISSGVTTTGNIASLDATINGSRKISEKLAGVDDDDIEKEYGY